MEDRFFFNPYGFGGSFGPNMPPNMMPPPSWSNNPNASKTTPKEFYENQYYYYRCLNEAMDYQIKSQDLAERISRMNNSQTKNG